MSAQRKLGKGGISFITFVSEEHLLNMQNPAHLDASEVTLLGVARA